VSHSAKQNCANNAQTETALAASKVIQAAIFKRLMKVASGWHFAS
jgi:hypothetical protein